MCCGCEDKPASAYANRFGALAVLNPTASPMNTDFSGSITFFNENDHDCEIATHMSFSPAEALHALKNQYLFLNIHELGDLSVAPASHEPGSTFIPLLPSTSTGSGPGPILRRLDRPLHLHVGNDQFGNKGIIGRRITMCCTASAANQSPVNIVAQGIVGYNSIPKATSPIASL